MVERIQEEEEQAQGKSQRGDSDMSNTSARSPISDGPQHIPLSQFQSTWKEKPRPQREGYGFRPRSGASTPTTPLSTVPMTASSSALTSQLQQHNLHQPPLSDNSRSPTSQQQVDDATHSLANTHINARQAAAVREGKQRQTDGDEEYDEEADFQGFSAAGGKDAGYFDDADDVGIVDAAGLGWPGTLSVCAHIHAGLELTVSLPFVAYSEKHKPATGIDTGAEQGDNGALDWCDQNRSGVHRRGPEP